MFNWLPGLFKHSKHDHRKRRHAEEEFTHRNVPAKLPPLRPQPTPLPNWHTSAPLKKGDRIGSTFNIYDVLGRGGFGIVYLVYDLELRKICALKTFRDELLADPQARLAFKREASHWVDLGAYPYILSAHSVLEILHRLYVRMDYVAPDEEGRVSLAHCLRGNSRTKIELEKQLEWGVQFCLGMEHANKHGISCHRDIKPENILITSDGVLKISDFGLAVVSEAASSGEISRSSQANASEDGYIGLSLVKAGKRNLCGTPGYIPPEVYRGEVADVRSDLYSFGLVLWQMAAQSPVPRFSQHFLKGDIEAYLRTVYETQMASQAPPVDGPMEPIITKCLCRQPADRYGSFTELRKEPETLLWRQAGKSVEVPGETQKSADSWYHHGVSLVVVGRHEESLAAFDQALQLAPRDPKSLVSRAAALSNLGHNSECIQSCDEALLIDPKYVRAYFTKGVALQRLQQKTAALACFEQCVILSPNYYFAWHNKSCCLTDLNRLDDALASCDRVIALQPRYPKSWNLKGSILAKQNRRREALSCFDEALKRDPQFATALVNKGLSLSQLKQLSDAILCYDAALAIDPNLALAWSEKGRNLLILKKYSKAIECYNKALALEPKFAMRWYNKGVAEDKMGYFKDAVASLSKFLELAQPEDQMRVPAVRARIQRLTREYY